MSMFKCSTCDYTNDRKSSLLRHIRKKNKCSDNPEIIEVVVRIDCVDCKKTFKTKQNLVFHQKTCVAYKLNKEKDIKINELETRLSKLEQTNTVVNVTNIANIDNSITVNNTLNIQLISYEKPNQELIQSVFDDLFGRYIYKSFVEKTIEQIHFNKEYPENHNLHISNLRTNIIKVFNGTSWKSEDADEVVFNLYDRYERMMDDYANGHPGCKKIEDHIEKYKEIKDKDVKNFEKTNVESIKKLIYDNRHMIQKS